MLSEFKELLRVLEARPLLAEKPCRRRLPKRASRFIRNGIESCKAEGNRVMVCVTRAYQQAKWKGLL